MGRAFSPFTLFSLPMNESSAWKLLESDVKEEAA